MGTTVGDAPPADAAEEPTTARAGAVTATTLDDAEDSVGNNDHNDSKTTGEAFGRKVR